MKNIKDYVLILIGSAIFSFGIAWFADPCGIVPGGISGIAIIISHISESSLGFKIPLSITNLVLNIPLFIICLRQRGFSFISRSLLSVAATTLFLEILKYFPAPDYLYDDVLIAALMTAVCLGVGIGFVMRCFSTTGGSDMLAAIIKFKNPHFPTAYLILIIDTVIIFAGLFVFGLKLSVYAVLTVLISSKIIDLMLGGFGPAKALYIISEKNMQISKQISDTLRRGNTLISAKGMYTEKQRDILMVVLSSKEVPVVKSIVHTLDPSAFMIISDVHEALGEGFSVLDNPKNSL